MKILDNHLCKTSDDRCCCCRHFKLFFELKDSSSSESSITVCIPIAFVAHDLSCFSCAAFKQLSSTFCCLASKMCLLLGLLLIRSVFWKVTGNSHTNPTDTSLYTSQRKMQVKECTRKDKLHQKYGVAWPITLRTLLIMDLHQPFEHLAGSFWVPKAATRAVWMQSGMHLQTNNKMSARHTYIIHLTCTVWTQQIRAFSHENTNPRSIQEHCEHTHWRRACNPSLH